MESVLKLKLWSPTPSKGPGPRPPFDSVMSQTMKDLIVEYRELEQNERDEDEGEHMEGSDDENENEGSQKRVGQNKANASKNDRAVGDGNES